MTKFAYILTEKEVLSHIENLESALDLSYEQHAFLEEDLKKELSSYGELLIKQKVKELDESIRRMEGYMKQKMIYLKRIRAGEKITSWEYYQ